MAVSEDFQPRCDRRPEFIDLPQSEFEKIPVALKGSEACGGVSGVRREAAPADSGTFCIYLPPVAAGASACLDGAR